jgi:pimeloyl-ACP methyl ester carboxylesterase
MQFATVADAHLAYDTAGDAGTPVILIMGFAVRGLAWRRQVPHLAERHQVIWFDNRGVGETMAPLRPLRMARFADDVTGLLDHLGHDRAHVVGISMGGMIAQHVALRHRDRVRSLSLIATHPGGRSAILPTRKGVGLFLRANRSEGSAQATMQLLMSQQHLATCDQDELLRALRDEFGVISRKARLCQLAAVLRHDTRKDLHRLEGLPTLIMQPADDLLVRSTHSAQLAAGIPGAKLVTVPVVGHGLLRERPQLVAKVIGDHLSAVDATA